MNRNFFDNLFVLEMTNNHLGSIERGLTIIHAHSRIVRFHGVRAAIKLQFRDVKNFVHKDFRARKDIKYINRVMSTALEKEDYAALCEAIRASGCIPLATPFDETSVSWCVEFGLPAIKVASADANDWPLLERIAATKLPVMVSFGGTPLKDMDDLVTFFERRNIELAVNHCVAAYPHEAGECELAQIDFLKARYPGHVVGWSTHEHGNCAKSVAIAYAKGARCFERHIDIENDGEPVATYSSMPVELNTLFHAHAQAVAMCGTAQHERRVFLARETAYLDSYVRGVWAKHDLKKGQTISSDDIYLAIPLLKGQLSCRELMLGENGHRLTRDIAVNEPVSVGQVDVPVALAANIEQRGMTP